MDNQPTPAGGDTTPKTEATPTNLNQSTETNSTPAPDLHGFTEEQLADMAKFYSANGGYEKVKQRLSNPEPAQPTQPTQPTEPTQPTQPEQPAGPAPLPKGFAKPQELLLEQYFNSLASRSEYANISKEISNGSILKEMTAMGMNPIDDNFNVNTVQLEQFLKLKSASVPTTPTETAPTNIPTVDFTEVGDNITDVNQALKVIEESRIAKSKGLAEHPSVAKAEEFLKNAWKQK